MGVSSQNLSVDYPVYHSSFSSKSLLPLFLCYSHSFIPLSRMFCYNIVVKLSLLVWKHIIIKFWDSLSISFSFLVWRSFISDSNFPTVRSFRVLVSLCVLLGMNFGCSCRGIFAGSCCERSLYIATSCELL